MEGSDSSDVPHVCESCTANLEETSQDKDKTLCFASSSGHLACLNALVEAGADVNSCSGESGYTALICATKKGSVEMIRRLIGLGADVNCLNKDGDVALQYATEAGFEECVKLLLEEGADVNYYVRCLKNFGTGFTGFTESEYHGKLDLRVEDIHKKLILKNLCRDVIRRHLLHISPVSLFVQVPQLGLPPALEEYLLDKQLDSRGNTALMSAAATGNDKCLELLLKSGANVNHYDQCGETALAYAAMKGSDSCIKVLLKAGVEISPDEGDVMWHYTMTSVEEARLRMMDFALFTAGEKPWGFSDEGHFFGDISIAEYLEDLRKKLILKNLCREVIRKHLLQVSPVNLFVRVPQLGLPAAVEKYLLHYNVSLDDDMEAITSRLSIM